MRDVMKGMSDEDYLMAFGSLKLIVDLFPCLLIKLKGHLNISNGHMAVD